MQGRQKKTGTWKRKKKVRKKENRHHCSVFDSNPGWQAHAASRCLHTQEVWAAGPVTKTGWLPWQTESAGNSPKVMTKNGMGERRKRRMGGGGVLGAGRKRRWGGSRGVGERLVWKRWEGNEKLSLLPLLKLLLRCLRARHFNPDLLVHWLFIYSFILTFYARQGMYKHLTMWFLCLGHKYLNIFLC